MIEWRKVKDFNYSVSNKGEVRNDKTGRILKKTVSTSGYLFVQLFDKKTYMKYIHRLVGEAFIPNPDFLPQIDHIDGDKKNNDVSNLRWVSVSENRLSYGNEERAKNRMRKVIARNENGEEIVFASRTAAGEYFRCGASKVKYGHLYQKGKKNGWIFYKVEDIV